MRLRPNGGSDKKFCNTRPPTIPGWATILLKSTFPYFQVLSKKYAKQKNFFLLIFTKTAVTFEGNEIICQSFCGNIFRSLSTFSKNLGKIRQCEIVKIR